MNILEAQIKGLDATFAAGQKAGEEMAERKYRARIRELKGLLDLAADRLDSTIQITPQSSEEDCAGFASQWDYETSELVKMIREALAADKESEGTK